MTVASILSDPISIPETQEGQIRELRRLVQQGHTKLVGPDGHQVAIPEPVHDLLLIILNNLQAGKAISIVPEHQQLTTQAGPPAWIISCRPLSINLLSGYLS